MHWRQGFDRTMGAWIGQHITDCNRALARVPQGEYGLCGTCAPLPRELQHERAARWFRREVVIRMFDVRQVLETVRDGKAPTDWRVLHARPGYFLAAGIAQLLGGLAVVALAALIVITQQYCLGLVSGSMALLFLFLAWTTLSELRTARDQMLVLMPEGVVNASSMSSFMPFRQLAYADIASMPFRQLAYADIASMSMRVDHGRRGGTSVELTVHFLEGIQTAISLDGRFGPREQLAASILEGWATYHATHVASQSS